MDLNTKLLNEHIDAFTKETKAGTESLAYWTKGLVFATVFLGLAALAAAGIQAYVTWTTPAQIITVGKP